MVLADGVGLPAQKLLTDAKSENVKRGTSRINRLRAARLVTPGRKLLAIHVGFALALARFQKGSDARSDLSLFYAQLVGVHLSARSPNASTHRAFKAAGHREAAIAA